MKNKILVIALGMLCSATMFAAKGSKGGGTAGESLSAVCSTSTALCDVTALNLVAGKTYQLQVTTNCAGESTATMTSTTNNPATVPVPVPSSACSSGINTVFFYLFIESSNGNRLQEVYSTSIPY